MDWDLFEVIYIDKIWVDEGGKEGNYDIDQKTEVD
jgi:hypothetical protein